MSELPPARQIVTAHDAQGKDLLSDTSLPTEKQGDSGYATAQGFTLTKFDRDPVEAFDGVGKAADGFAQTGGVALRYVDVEPKRDTVVHFTNSIDYLVMTHGELELALKDGQKTIVRQGDTIVQLGNIHGWNNKTDKWARFVCICLPSTGVRINGKPLSEEPFNSYKLG